MEVKNNFSNSSESKSLITKISRNLSKSETNFILDNIVKELPISLQKLALVTLRRNHWEFMKETKKQDQETRNILLKGIGKGELKIKPENPKIIEEGNSDREDHLRNNRNLMKYNKPKQKGVSANNLSSLKQSKNIFKQFVSSNKIQNETVKEIKYKHLECVLKFKEPSNIEISHLHQFLSQQFQQLSPNLCSDFFGYEERKLESRTEEICRFLESGKEKEPKQLILSLVMCAYLRLFDTQRFGLLLSMWRVMKSIKTVITKQNINFMNTKECLLIVNVCYVLLAKTKWFADKLQNDNSQVVFWKHLNGIGFRGNWVTLTGRIINQVDMKLFENNRCQSEIRSILSRVVGAEQLIRFHGRIIHNVLLKGETAKIEDLLNFYRVLISSCNFEVISKTSFVPKFKFKYLYEIISLEHLFGKKKIYAFSLFWNQLRDKLIYIIDLLNYTTGNKSDKSHEYLVNFLNFSKQRPDIFRDKDSFDREEYRLATLSHLIVTWRMNSMKTSELNNSNNNHHQINKQSANKGEAIQEEQVKQLDVGRKSLTKLESKKNSLMEIITKKITEDVLEKLMGIDLGRLLEAEKEVKIGEGLHEGMDKEGNTSILSKSIIAEDSILGSVAFLDMHNPTSNNLISQSRNSISLC